MTARLDVTPSVDITVSRSRFDPDRATLAHLLDGEPRYRLDQLWDGLYRQVADVRDMTDPLAARRRRLSFEWALIDGVNDRPGDATELAAFARPLRAHVNLIPLNPTPGYAARGTAAHAVAAFAERLRALGTNVTVRRNRGTDIDAACGQLRAAQEPAVPVAPPQHRHGRPPRMGSAPQRTSTVTP